MSFYKEFVMKAVLLASALVIGAGTLAFADMPGKDWMSKEQVTTKLKSMGYSDVMKLEADDGHWEGDAMKDGKAFEIHVDPHTGELTKNEPKD
jgi:hypothetical protein